MPLQKVVETICPCCQEEIVLTDFDPADLDQEIECGECNAVFEEWAFQGEVLSLVVPPDDEEDESAVILDATTDDEEDEEFEDEDPE